MPAAATNQQQTKMSSESFTEKQQPELNNARTSTFAEDKILEVSVHHRHSNAKLKSQRKAMGTCKNNKSEKQAQKKWSVKNDNALKKHLY
ncbi:hypothetical protein VNO80_11744 [Phaseolus coccineus]|uniref:Uncharacterized protein n=1 Tax=Phaseolus coccineus TaxID=3886 RepID=A0AAN9NC77_PHACN